MIISEDLLRKLACPACKGNVIIENITLKCLKCSKVYPIENDIPVMLIKDPQTEN